MARKGKVSRKTKETSINVEVNNQVSQKRLKFLRDTREQILKKYYKLTIKLNTND